MEAHRNSFKKLLVGRSFFIVQTIIIQILNLVSFFSRRLFEIMTEILDGISDEELQAVFRT
jgi:hypothetical protein